eukprot:7388449-Prymnesium_polylepis.1
MSPSSSSSSPPPPALPASASSSPSSSCGALTSSWTAVGGGGSWPCEHARAPFLRSPPVCGANTVQGASSARRVAWCGVRGARLEESVVEQCESKIGVLGADEAAQVQLRVRGRQPNDRLKRARRHGQGALILVHLRATRRRSTSPASATGKSCPRTGARPRRRRSRKGGRQGGARAVARAK